jgi:hypothetical protein
VKRAIGYSALGLLLLALVFGCTFGMTLPERIQQFASDLTLVDRTNAYLNFHSTDTLDYTAIQDPVFWDTPFPLSTPGVPATYYTITIVDSTDPLAVTATIDSSAMGVGTPFNAIFKMAYEGLDYKIVTLQVDWGVSGFEDVVN